MMGGKSDRDGRATRIMMGGKSDRDGRVTRIGLFEGDVIAISIILQLVACDMHRSIRR
jgi:hypothetical protein